MILSDAELNGLVSEFKTGQARVVEIGNLGNELTQVHLKEAGDLRTKLQGIKAKIEAHNQVAELKRFGRESEGFLTEPVRTIPVPDGSGSVEDVAVKAGESYVEIDHKGQRRVIHDDGAGVMGDATWKAINDPHYQKAVTKYVRTGLGSLNLAERKLLESGLDPQGGYTVPVDQLAKVIGRSASPNRIAGMVSSLDTNREFVEMMKVNYNADNIYTSGFRVTKTGENPLSSTSHRITDTNLFGVIRIPVHTFMMSGILTQNQLEDSALNLMGWMGDKFRETVEVLYDQKILVGSGKGEASGISAYYGTAADSVTETVTGDASNILADSLFDVALAVPEQYDDNCRWIFNKTDTFRKLRKLKDADGRYLFGVGVQDSGLRAQLVPSDLLGYPFTFSALMPNVAAGTYPVIFGDLRGYQFVRRIGFSVQVLRELYAELNQVALVGRVRFGGQVVEPWRLRTLKVSA